MQRGIGSLSDDAFRQLVPLGYAGDVMDVAGSVEYLLSAAGDYINGASLVIDGGLLTRRR